MVPVVIAFTSNYLIPAATLVHSVLRNSSSSFEFVCLTEKTVPEQQRRKLEKMVQGRVSFRYLEKMSLPEEAYIDARYSAAAEYRLLLPELLPDYDKVLYIDCDVIIRNDLAPFYETANLGSNLLGVVYERTGYFNSGFLLMNLEQMRKEKTSQKLMEVLKTDYLEFPDQDALNKVCSGRVLALPPYHNGIRTFWLPQYRNEFLALYSEEDFEEMVSHGNIHYTGGKPWDIFTVRFGDWWDEYSQLPEEIKQEWTPSSRIATISKFYSNRLGRKCIDSLQSVYRMIKYKI